MWGVRQRVKVTGSGVRASETRRWMEGDGWHSWPEATVQAAKRARQQQAVWDRAAGAQAARRAREVEDGWDSWPDELPVAGTQAPPALVRPASAGVTVDDTDALDCGVCCLPLKPPIFQCEVGHVVCVTCCSKLRETGKCHVCNIPIVEYKRCYAMERLVESANVRCPNAAYGCSYKSAYYDQHNHRQMCVHAPCHCPGEACPFIGSKTALWDHLSGVHSWPRSRGRTSNWFRCNCVHGLANYCECTWNLITLRLGFNFFLADHASDGYDATPTSTANSNYLFLLYVARQPVGCVISMLCIDPHATAAAGDAQGSLSKEVECDLLYKGNGDRRPGGRHQVIEHYQISRFKVACTDLSNGLLSSHENCFQLVVPDSIVTDIDGDAIKVTDSIAGDHDGEAIQIRARIVIKQIDA